MNILFSIAGSVPCVVVSTAEAAKELFRGHNDECLISRPKMLGLEILSDNYQLMAYAPAPGKLWHSLRKFGSMELFSFKRVAFYRSLREEELRHWIKFVLESREGEAMNLKSCVFELAANMMTRMLVNKRS